MEEAPRYEATYIVSPVARSVPIELLPSDDPDVIAYNECKIALHFADDMCAKMRYHLNIIEQRIINKINSNEDRDKVQHRRKG